MVSITENIRNIVHKAYVGNPTNIIEVECNDTEGSLVRLLTYIMRTGNIGHSFDIVVDPDNKEHKMSFGWDGDGSDSIRNIRVNGKKVGFKDYFEKDKEHSEKYLEMYKKKSTVTVCKNSRTYTPDEAFCNIGCSHVIDPSDGRRRNVNKGAICPYSPNNWSNAKKDCDCYR